MKVVVGSVVKGFALKTAVQEYPKNSGHKVIEVGCYDTSVSAKSSSIAERAARLLQDGEADIMGMSCCGSGTGMALAAGRFAETCAISAQSPRRDGCRRTAGCGARNRDAGAADA